ncbi:hypothetical protein [Enterococcus innesii]|uniref:hypothetical protein n=1 Tax=Enterococcus innesii TaxID=2839759 RepID=UPI0034A1D5A5
MDCVEKRADTMAKIIRENTDTINEKEMLLAELINDELLREDITFNQKLQIIKQVMELVEIQEPLTKEERLAIVWEHKNLFSIRTINLGWKKEELARYCDMYGVTIEAFVHWKLGRHFVSE